MSSEDHNTVLESSRMPGTWALILAGIMIAAVAGAVTGGVIALVLERDADKGAEVQAKGPDPELVSEMEGLRAELEAGMENMDTLRAENAELIERMDAIAGKLSADVMLREALPSPYLRQVDDFFKSDKARTLLSASAQQNGKITFYQPSFISDRLISAPYSLEQKRYYLLVNITILDYYDLRFDVLWDSQEAEVKP